MAITTTATATATPTTTPTPIPTAAALATAAAPSFVFDVPSASLSGPSHLAVRESRNERERQLTDARRLAKGHMSDARALKGWAQAAYKAGELREARRAAETWTLHDGTAEPRLFLATVLDASGRKSDARVVLEEWLQLHPESADARAMHARLGGPISQDPNGKKQIARR